MLRFGAFYGPDSRHTIALLRAARMGLEQPIEQAIEIELECYRRMVDHPDRFEGVAAFNERRKPEFQDCY